MNIEDYLESKKNAWAATTIKTARAKLKQLLPLMASGPASCHSELLKLGYKPYSVKQYMIIAANFSEFYDDQSYARYIKDNAQAFKNAYVPKAVSLSFEEAHARISNIEDARARALLHGLLKSGLRISEPQTLQDDGRVIGKGSKTRIAPNYNCVIKERLTGKTRQALAQCTDGKATPHTLRKLFATRAVELGAREADLCRLMGWSSIATAASYVQATRADEIAKKIAFETENK